MTDALTNEGGATSDENARDATPDASAREKMDACAAASSGSCFRGAT